jgi:ribokinase
LIILVAGSANLDFVVSASHIPAPGETVLGERFQTFPGGKGANQAVACARASGAETHMLLALGRDDFAKPLTDSLSQAGVVQHTVLSAQPTGCAFICVSSGGDNAITVAPGANAALRPEHWASHVGALTGVSHLLMQLETPLQTVAFYAKAAREAGVRVVLNAAPAQPLPSDLLTNVDVLVVNEGELFEVVQAKTGQQSLSITLALQALDVPAVVVTLGARGSCAWVNNTLVAQPSFQVDVVDTTGAGDTFCGALTGALSQGIEMAQALRTASAAGALACTQLGAQSSMPTAQTVAQFLEQHRPAQDSAVHSLLAYCNASKSR